MALLYKQGTLSVEGTDEADTLVGNGRGGSLFGRLGNDSFFAGVDQSRFYQEMFGGFGDDQFVFGGGNRVTGGPGADTFNVFMTANSARTAEVLDYNMAEGDALNIDTSFSFGFSEITGVVTRDADGSGGTARVTSALMFASSEENPGQFVRIGIEDMDIVFDGRLWRDDARVALQAEFVDIA